MFSKDTAQGRTFLLCRSEANNLINLLDLTRPDRGRKYIITEGTLKLDFATCDKCNKRLRKQDCVTIVALLYTGEDHSFDNRYLFSPKRHVFQ